MKRKIVSYILAAAIAVAPVLPYNVVKAENVIKYAVELDGKAFEVRSTVLNGNTVFSLRDLSAKLGGTINWDAKKNSASISVNGKSITFIENSNVALVDGRELQLGSPSKIVNKILFIDAKTFMEALGGEFELLDDKGKAVLSTVKVLDEVESIAWVDALNVVVGRAGDEGQEYYLINTKTKAYKKIIGADQAVAEVAVSEDGKKLAYVAGEGTLYIYDLATGTAKDVYHGEDKADNLPSELQWSKDGSAVYFVQGQKANAFAKLTIADGKVSTVMTDKAGQISDVVVTNEGKKVIYTLTKTGKVTADSVAEDSALEKLEEAKLEIDSTGTEPQLYSFDTTAKDAKPVALTTDKENKVFVNALKDGRIVYLSVDEVRELPVLKLIDAEGKATDLVKDKMILQNLVTADNRIIILAVDGLYEVDVNTKATKKIDTVEAAQVFISKDGKQYIYKVDGQLFIKADGSLQKIAK